MPSALIRYSAIALLAGLTASMSVSAQTVELRLREMSGQTFWSPGDPGLDFVVEASVSGGTPGLGLAALQFSIAFECEPEYFGTLQRLRISNADGSYYTGAPTAATSQGSFAGVAYHYRAVVAQDPSANGLINASGGTHVNNVSLHDIGAVHVATSGPLLLPFLDLNSDGTPDINDGVTAPMDIDIANSFFGAANNTTQLYRFRYTTINFRCRNFRIDLVPTSATVFSQLVNVNGVWQPDTRPATVNMPSYMFVPCLNPPRPGDYDLNGVPNIADIFLMLNDWFAGCIGGVAGAQCSNRSADVNCNGTLEVNDIFTFVNIWFGHATPP